MAQFHDIGENKKNIQALREQLRTNLGVIPFVGAGFSVPCGLPQWSELLLSLAQKVSIKSLVDDLLKDGKFEEAAGELERAYGIETFSQKLHEVLSGSSVKKLVGPVLQVPALTRGPVITTNLDNILEKVFDNAGFPFLQAGYGPDIRLARGILHQDHAYLLKMHGDIKDSSTRVLTLQDYERAYGSKEADLAILALPLPKLLEQIFTTRTLLFLGCSLVLDRTLIYMRRVRMLHGAPARHFAVLEDTGSEGSRLQREKFLDELNISPIWFPHRRYDLIEELIEELLEPTSCKSPDIFRNTKLHQPFKGIFGIDLGTSYTSVAYSRDGQTIEFLTPPQSNGRTLIPSIVYFLDKCQYQIWGPKIGEGEEAQILREICYFKRSLGTNTKYRVDRKIYTPTKVATLFLKSIRDIIAEIFSIEQPKAIISAPANFGATQINELAKAYQLAGFNVLRIVREPCAAAINSRGLEPHELYRVLVVDIGGGTTDISGVEVSLVDGEWQIEIINVAGDNELGGLDFDRIICEHVHNSLKNRFDQYGQRIYEERYFDIERQARNAKAVLNMCPSAPIVLRDIELTQGETTDLVITVSREDFENDSKHLLARLGGLVNEVMPELKMSETMVSSVMLAGQASKILPVRAFIESHVSLPIIDQFQEIAVASGLAIQASVLAGTTKDFLLLDSIYRTLYVGFSDDLSHEDDDIAYDEDLNRYSNSENKRFLIVIEKNTLIPTQQLVSNSRRHPKGDESPDWNG